MALLIMTKTNLIIVSFPPQTESFFSDEKTQTCQLIKFPAGFFYNSERPPFKKEVGKSVESKPSTEVTAVVTIIKLIEINEADSTFDLFFKIQLKWSDNNNYMLARIRYVLRRFALRAGK